MGLFRKSPKDALEDVTWRLLRSWSEMIGDLDAVAQSHERSSGFDISADPTDRDLAIHDLTSYVLTNFSLAMIGYEFRLCRMDVKDIIHRLERHGAIEFAFDFYVPVMAVCWPGTLAYSIHNIRDGDERDQLDGTLRILEYFQNAETAPLRQDGTLLS